VSKFWQKVGILTSDDDLLQSVGKRLGPGAERFWHLFPLMFAGVIRNRPGASSSSTTPEASPPPNSDTKSSESADRVRLPPTSAAPADAPPVKGPGGAPEPMIVGDQITEVHRAQLRASMRGMQFSLEDAMDFLEGLPRDMLLVMRTINLVSGVHRALGGDNLEKFRCARLLMCPICASSV